jgi:hypothetical protein
MQDFSEPDSQFPTTWICKLPRRADAMPSVDPAATVETQGALHRRFPPDAAHLGIAPAI